MVPSGIVASPSKARLLHESLTGAVPTTGFEVGTAGACVAAPAGTPPVTGVLTNEKVGRAAASTVGDGAEEVSARVGNAMVGTAAVSVGVGVLVGAASAVCVNCPES